MTHDVFISYSSEDKLQADAICNRLESQGIRCWIAPRDVPAGPYADSLVQAIESTKVMVLVYSTHAQNSSQVSRELEVAVSKGITIVPVRLEDAEMTKEFRYYVGAMHWLDAMTPPLEQHIDKLARDLKALLAKNGRAVAPAPVAAPSAPEGQVTPAPAPPPPAPPAPPAPQPSAGGRRIGMYAAAAIVLAAVGGTATYFVVGTGSRIVPDVAGLDRADAEAKLARANLRVERAVEVRHERLPRHKVVGTEPGAGQPAPAGGAVTLEVSGMTVLPNVQGKTEKQASSMLNLVGVSTVRVQPRDSAEAAGLVVGMEPGPGQTMFSGDGVTLFVSAHRLTVPDVVNRPLAEARRVLEKDGRALKIAVVRQSRPGVDNGRVFATEPATGTQVAPGSTVTLNVAARVGWIYVGGLSRSEQEKLSKGRTARMVADLNLRSGPVTNAPQLGTVRRDEQVEVLEAPGVGWIRIAVGD